VTTEPLINGLWESWNSAPTDLGNVAYWNLCSLIKRDLAHVRIQIER
jgi:hypothetical protein